MSAHLNTSEITALRAWLADGAPRFIRDINAFAGGMNPVSIQESDYVSIDALDNDVVRGYLTTYLPIKETILNNNIASANGVIEAQQLILMNTQSSLTIITGVVIQAVPT